MPPHPAALRNAAETLSLTGDRCVEVTIVQADKRLHRGLHEMLGGHEAAATDCSKYTVISEDPQDAIERIYVKTGLGSKERGRKGKQARAVISAKSAVDVALHSGCIPGFPSLTHEHLVRLDCSTGDNPGKRASGCPLLRRGGLGEGQMQGPLPSKPRGQRPGCHLSTQILRWVSPACQVD